MNRRRDSKGRSAMGSRLSRHRRVEVWYTGEVDQDHGAPHGRSAGQSGTGDLEARPPFDEPVELPTEDVLDLHPFAPRDIPSVVEEYLAQCRRAGLSEVRLIHGKGTGAQRAVVRGLLANHPDVLTFADAQPQAGGWGATLVRLKAPESQVPSSEFQVPS